MKCLNLFVVVVLSVVLLSDTSLARRTGGGGGRRGGSSGGLGSWFSGGSKKTSNPQSSYPKQTWSQSGTGTGTATGAGRQPGNNLGSGGFSNPNQNVGGFGGNKQGSNVGGGGFVNPNQGPGSFGNNRQGSNNFGQNYGGGYGYPNNVNRQGSFGGSSVGGGGFVNPNRGWSNPNVGRSHGYYGAGGSSIFGNSYASNNYRRSPFGGFSGSRGLAVGAGAGFIGGAVAGIAAVSMYHQYRQFQSMMYCVGNPMCYGGGYGYGGYGGYGYGRRILVNHEDCVGGCPNQAYCDIGICRCREGYEAKYGQCWKTIDEFNVRSKDWEARAKPNYNPYHGCSNHKDCHDVDMNMVCTGSKCSCRKDMAWNDEVQECQIFVNVTCTDIDVDSNGPQAAALTDFHNVTSTSAEYDYDSGNGTHEDFGDHENSTSPIDESPFDKVVNVSSVTINETLADSELLKIDLNKTSEKEVRAAFCREIARTAKRYAPNPIPQKKDETSGGTNTLTTALIVISSLVLIGGTVFYLVKKCSRRGNRGAHKQESRDYSEDEPPRAAPNEAMQFSALQNPPPYTTNDQGGYPEVPVPYPPGPDNPYYNAQQPVYPPSQPYQQPPQPQVYPYPYPDPNQQYPPAAGVPAYGQPAAPYNPAPGAMPYPPAGPVAYPPAPYPPGPGQAAPYPPQ